MGTCFSKKFFSGTANSLAEPSSVSTLPAETQRSLNGSCETNSALKSVDLGALSKTILKKHSQQQEEYEQGRMKKEIFVIKHRKSHDEKERNPTSSFGNVSLSNEKPNENKLIQCGSLSRNSSGKATATPSKKYTGSKRSYDFDNYEHNDSVSADDDQRRTISTESNSDLCEDYGGGHQPRQRQGQSPRSFSRGRRRTPSRERDQNHRSNSRERRVSRSPGRRPSETNTYADFASASACGTFNNNNHGANRPGQMVSVPATVTSLVMVKSNNGGGMGVESATSAGIEKPSLGHRSPRKSEQSLHRRNALGEFDTNTNPLTYTQAPSNGSKVQRKNRKELEREAHLKQNKEINEKGIGESSVVDNIIVKTMITSGIDSPNPQPSPRTRSSRWSRDLDLNLEEMVDGGQSYTSLLLQDIQNFHQKSTPSVPLPACVTKAFSIVEAVNDLTSTSTSNLSCAFSEDRCSPSFQFDRNGYSMSFGGNHTGKKMTGTKDPFVEAEVVVFDDVMEPSYHKYATVGRGGGLGGDLEDQESSGSNSFVKSG